MADAIPGFDAAAFRDGIRQAMRMAMPNDPERWPKFVFPAEPAGGDVDADGVPWDAAAAPERAELAEVQGVLCAVETGGRSEHTRHFGPLQPGFAELTFLDEEWERVEGFAEVLLFPTSGDPVPYSYRRVLLATNLDVVGVKVVEVAAGDVV